MPSRARMSAPAIGTGRDRGANGTHPIAQESRPRWACLDLLRHEAQSERLYWALVTRPGGFT